MGQLDARGRILRAAERLFAEKGFAATSVQEITDAAEVNKALLYYYFEDKHSLYVSLIDDGIEQMRCALDDALRLDASPTERLRRFVCLHVDLLWSRRDLLQVVQRCVMAGEHEGVGLLDKFQEVLDRLERFFQEAQEAGELTGAEPFLAARSTLALPCGYAFWDTYGRESYTREQVAAHVTALLLHGLHGPASASSPASATVDVVPRAERSTPAG